MPSLGADMDSGTLLEWLVQVGDTVHRGDPVAVVDTDKSAIEVESFDDGVVASLLVEPGTRVAVGTPLATFAPLGAEVPATVGTAAVETPAEPVASPPTTVREPAAGLVPAGGAAAAARSAPSRPAVSPYARRLAGELGLDLARVQGSGRAGEVRAADVLAERARTTDHPVPAPAGGGPEAGPAAPPPTPPAAPPPAAPSSRSRPQGHPGVSSTRTTIAALMARAKREIPHYYVASTVDLHALTEWLRRTNRERPVPERIVPAAAILKAAALALREHPELNGFWAEDGYVPGEDVHLGVAVSVRDGALVAPAIRHAADLSLPETMAALRDLVKRARSGRLRRAEMADPTFTVTDLGDLGAEEVIGVIYPPQVGLLGVGRIVEHPWAADGMIGVRPTVRLTLSGDHRATDGATGSRFLATLERLLQHPEEL